MGSTEGEGGRDKGKGRKEVICCSILTQEEVNDLHRKLQWYAENQRLLDQECQTMREKDREIAALREKVASLQVVLYSTSTINHIVTWWWIRSWILTWWIERKGRGVIWWSTLSADKVIILFLEAFSWQLSCC